MRYELSDYEWTAIKPMLPNKPRGARRVDDRRVLYRARNLVERFFNRIKQCRRVATRYDKLAANYLAFIKLASIRIWLRAHESTP
jgi:transposase